MIRVLSSLLLLCILYSISFAIPSLPSPRCAGSAVVWGDSIYYLGGSNNWSGTICYTNIYRYNGTTWDSLPTEIPDANTWGGNAVIVGDSVYYVSGWPSAPGGIRRLKLSTNTWNDSTLPSCAVSQSWGTTAQYIHRDVYLFSGDGSVYIFNVDSNSWRSGTSRNGSTGGGYLSSVVDDSVIYVLGYNDGQFGRYSPATQQWTILSSPMEDSMVVSLQAGCIGKLGNRLYVAASVPNAGTSSFVLNNIIFSYEPATDEWNIDNDTLPSGRAWCAEVMYHGGFYIIGGMIDGVTPIDSVAQVVPLGFTAVGEKPTYSLPGNFAMNAYPNPFNPMTHIVVNYTGSVRLTIYNQLGQMVAHRELTQANTGQYKWNWNAGTLPSGMYFLNATTEKGTMTKSLLLLK